jgi:hypothetical protein
VPIDEKPQRKAEERRQKVRASFGSLTTNSSVFIVDVTSDDDETSALCSKLLVTVLDLFLFFNLNNSIERLKPYQNDIND